MQQQKQIRKLADEYVQESVLNGQCKSPISPESESKSPVQETGNCAASLREHNVFHLLLQSNNPSANCGRETVLYFRSVGLALALLLLWSPSACIDEPI